MRFVCSDKSVHYNLSDAVDHESLISDDDPVYVIQAECARCRQLMPAARIDVGMETCTNCTDQSTYVGIPDYTHKTGHSIGLIKNSKDNQEAIRKGMNFGTCVIRRNVPQNMRAK